MTNIEEMSLPEKRALLQKLLREKLAKARPDLDAEAEIDLSLAEASVDPTVAPSDVFLTGATGFVGAFVLRELLDTTDARVHCLVRAEDEAAARERVIANLEYYDISTADLDERVVMLPGDLAAPLLGFSPELWEAVTRRMDAVYHIAAEVNLAFDYRKLKRANVDGTKEIMKLAATGQVKPLNYLSSYAVFDSMQNVGQIFGEYDPPIAQEQLSTGYSESKWVAELAVKRGADLGIPTALYRVGWVIGDSRSGAWKHADFLPRLLKIAVETGIFCDFGTFTMTPVDFVAKALVHLSSRPDALGQIFHLSNGKRYASQDLFDWVRSDGYALQEVTIDEWKHRMSGSSQELSLAPMLLFLGDGEDGAARLSQWISKEPNVDVSRTAEILASCGVVCPDLDAERMSVFVSRLVAHGHLPAPRSAKGPADGSGGS